MAKYPEVRFRSTSIVRRGDRLLAWRYDHPAFVGDRIGVHIRLLSRLTPRVALPDPAAP